MIKIKPRFKELKEQNLPNSKDMAKKYKHKEIIKLNYNESKFGFTPNLNGAIEIKSPNIYPEFRDHPLIDKLSENFDLSKEHFYVSNGSDAILEAIPTLFASARKEHNVLVPELTFGRIQTTCLVNDVETKKIKLVDGKISLKETLKAIDENTRIIYIVNPNMPTGTYNNENEMIEFLEKVPNNILVVVDGAYSEFVEGIDKSIEIDKKLIERFDNVLITHTFSKMYGLASFRIGYAIARPYIIEIFDKALQALPINKYSLQAATIALNDKQFYMNVIEQVWAEKEFLYSEYDRLGLKYLKTTGNFIFIDTKDKEFTNKEIREFILTDSGVMIRCVRDFGLRITIGTHKENLMLINSMEKFLNEK
ncbi:histidinol-phosphate transaminase [Mycoplasma marinum]|uniref:Aminotransferase class I/classII large domain-containing protein n=1 Tax=Mycoplasma marinum TaxID=1937190 RepID=A0A4R0XSS1_9MOLU|nr:histidinol-phosphate transaminase [Mycoplasma marinum]TCG11490.1 hypothetical protein C4B24_01900 [Mycoplasma marinum]